MVPYFIVSYKEVVGGLDFQERSGFMLYGKKGENGLMEFFDTPQEGSTPVSEGMLLKNYQETLIIMRSLKQSVETLRNELNVLLGELYSLQGKIRSPF